MSPEPFAEHVRSLGLELMSEADEQSGSELIRSPHPLAESLGLRDSGSEALATWFVVKPRSARLSDKVVPKQAGAHNFRFKYEAANDDWKFRPCPDASVGSAGRCDIQWAWFSNMGKVGDGYCVGFTNQSTYVRIARFWVIYDF